MQTPGIMLAFSVVLTGLYENENLQIITIALLIGAAVSLFFGQYLYTLDVNKQIKHATFVFLCNVCFFLYCRWYLFPKHSLLFIEDVKNTPLGDTFLMKMLYAAGCIFSVFNVAICADIIPMTYRYVKRCIDGTTPLEIKPVPSSRDSMVVQSYKRGSYTGRRESILRLARRTSLTAGRTKNSAPRRNSSLTSALTRMVTLDDMAMAQNLGSTVEGSFTERTEDEDSDISEEDNAALQATVAQMGMEKKTN